MFRSEGLAPGGPPAQRFIWTLAEGFIDPNIKLRFQSRWRKESSTKWELINTQRSKPGAIFSPDPTMTSSIFNPPPKPQPQMSNCPPFTPPRPPKQHGSSAASPGRGNYSRRCPSWAGGLDPNRAGSTEQGREEGSGAGDGALPPPLRKHNLRPVTRLVPGAQSTEISPVAAQSYELVWRAAAGANQVMLKMRQNGWYHAWFNGAF